MIRLTVPMLLLSLTACGDRDRPAPVGRGPGPAASRPEVGTAPAAAPKDEAAGGMRTLVTVLGHARRYSAASFAGFPDTLRAVLAAAKAGDRDVAARLVAAQVGVWAACWNAFCLNARQSLDPEYVRPKNRR